MKHLYEIDTQTLMIKNEDGHSTASFTPSIVFYGTLEECREYVRECKESRAFLKSLSNK